jgi:DNA-binding Xre family transcriptional regulator|tara:strand:+ start:1235 stop:1435 length:201 start_codon:yes stop_codon:yes gene_type:complete
MDSKIKDLIEYGMYKKKINKVQLASYMNMSYPTISTKINNGSTLKFSEAKRLGNILDIDLGKFLKD